MEVFYSKLKLTERLNSLRTFNSIGFTPTMGALHFGHLSLIEQSTKDNDISVVSIFVNPTQFNDKNDLLNYPRNLTKDLNLLENTKTNIVFVPDEKEIYPAPDKRIFDFKDLDKIMEGKYRPGHFNGVAQIVTKFFDIIKPDNAYFGLKDFQQLAIIKYLTKLYDIQVSIISCPIIREKDGLAMSSRNILLSDNQRKLAPEIYKILSHIKKKINKYKSVSEIKDIVSETINKISEMTVEYFEIVNENTLENIQDINSKDMIGCIAVRVGKIRLIDNIKFS